MNKRLLWCLPVLLLFTTRSMAQAGKVTASGLVVSNSGKTALPFVSVVLKRAADSSFAGGTITQERGRFTLSDIAPGAYLLQLSLTGFSTTLQPLSIGSLSSFLDLGTMELLPAPRMLDSVMVTAGAATGVSDRLDKKTYSVADNLAQAGGSVLQVMSSLPGISTTQEGRIQLRGSDKVIILVDGKQTALTGFDGQGGLDNIPASAIERIEIINNPSARYEAAGNAGIINIIFKKSRQEGFNGKAGMAAGLGALWEKRGNLPGIRPQYRGTPKINPSLSLNYRKGRVNTFLQGDYLYTETLNRNEFTERYYDNGEVVRQQVKRNRNTGYATGRAGFDYVQGRNTISLSGLFNREKIIDRGDIPYYNSDLSKMNRLWQFLEDEVKYTATATAAWQHRFQQPGRLLSFNYNYTWHREDERYFFTNRMPTFTGEDAFKLLSDEFVNDFSLDYIRPLRRGRFEAGAKVRLRSIPINMEFFPGLNSPIDSNAGGPAEYRETIPALYGNYVLEQGRWEVEAGLRVEYAGIDYYVHPDHNTYTSDGYAYTRPFPNMRLAYKWNERNKVSLFYNRRVDRPQEVDIRIFPKYDEPELLKVGNPGLRPQFAQTVEVGHRYSGGGGSLYTALYHRIIDGTITRIATQVPGSTILYNVFQNAGRSYNTGAEMVYAKTFSQRLSLNASVNVYRNRINAFTVVNRYPQPSVYTSGAEEAVSGFFKLNANFRLPGAVEAQVTAIYLAPDIIPQGRIGARASADLGLRKAVQEGKGEVFLNATDLFNTLNVRKEIRGSGFRFNTADYYETQVVRAGYSFKF